MSALLATLGEKQADAGGRPQVLEGLLRRERQRWRATAALAGLADLAPEVGERAVAMASMVGAGDEAEATALLTAVSDLADATQERRSKLARWLHELYDGDAYLNPLQPDLLLARHLGRVLKAHPDLVVRLFDVTPGRRLPLISTLVMAGTDDPDLSPVLQHFVAQRLDQLVSATLDDRALASPVARLCQLAPVPELAAAVVYKLPERSTSLAALAAVLAEHAVDHYRTLAEAHPDAFGPELALLLINLSNRLADLGRREAALDPIEEAVGHYRALAEAHPDAFGPYLAASLTNLSDRLAELGREEEAEAAGREAALRISSSSSATLSQR